MLRRLLPQAELFVLQWKLPPGQADLSRVSEDVAHRQQDTGEFEHKLCSPCLLFACDVPQEATGACLLIIT